MGANGPLHDGSAFELSVKGVNCVGPIQNGSVISAQGILVVGAQKSTPLHTMDQTESSLFKLFQVIPDGRPLGNPWQVRGYLIVGRGREGRGNAIVGKGVTGKGRGRVNFS